MKYVLISMLFVIGCKENVPNQPEYKPKLWSGDSYQGGISRKQNKEFIRANDPKFDDFVAMKYQALSCVMKTYVFNCKEYKKKEVECDPESIEQIKELISKYQ